RRRRKAGPSSRSRTSPNSCRPPMASPALFARPRIVEKSAFVPFSFSGEPRSGSPPNVSATLIGFSSISHFPNRNWFPRPVLLQCGVTPHSPIGGLVMRTLIVLSVAAILASPALAQPPGGGRGFGGGGGPLQILASEDAQKDM